MGTDLEFETNLKNCHYGPQKTNKTTMNLIGELSNNETSLRFTMYCVHYYDKKLFSIVCTYNSSVFYIFSCN